MNRIVKFLVGLILAAAGGVFLTNATYALWHALDESAYDQMLYPGIYAAVCLIVLLIGLRIALRAIVPGFTFTRLILAAVIFIVVLHIGGYLSLSSEQLKGYADSVQKWMRRASEAVPDAIKDSSLTGSEDSR